MELLTNVFHEVLFRPIFNLLVFTYDILPGNDFGLAVIIVTLIVRVAFYPLSDKALKAQKKLQDLQPQIKAIQAKYKTKEEQAKAVMEFYRENKVSPFSGCLPILVQLPLLIALYRVFLVGLDSQSLHSLYSFVDNPQNLDPMFLGIVDLSKSNFIFALLAGLSQFLQAKTMPKPPALTGGKNDFSQSMTQSMTYMMPLFMVFIAMKLPAGLALYWVVTMIFSIGQQIMASKNLRILKK